MPDDDFGRDAFIAATGAGAAGMARLDAYAATLTDWNARMNLVSPASLADLWRRHMFDSAQLVPLIPDGTRRIVDLGSGAGFPGLVLAALRPDGVGLETVLVESIEKKCAFLRAAAEAMGLGDTVRVLRARAEEVTGIKADLVTARAMAPLDQLLGYAKRFADKQTVLLFPKGRTAADELTAARRSWTLEAEMIPSRSDGEASIIVIRQFADKGRRS
ncbi:MAG: 16S rRNA (guanine(527)-N(7))-methyltransferase RsmG [Micropepsaceae bacterium]